MSNPAVTSKDPTVSWTDPNANTDGSTPVKTPSGYLIGLRDFATVGSAAGMYPMTATVAGGAATSAKFSTLGFVLLSGHTYGIAAESEIGGAAVGAWAPEYVFTYSPPDVIPNPPTITGVS